MKPHILMLTPYLPYPPVSGGRSRTYNLIKHLREEYEITLVCFGRPEEQAFDIAPLRQLCQVVVVDRDPSPGTLKAAILSLTTAKPITMRLYGTQQMKSTLTLLLRERKFDVIHVESFYMIQNLPENHSIPTLLSEPAIEHLVWQKHATVAQPIYTRPGIALEAAKMKRHEPREWSKADIVGAMSEVDQALIQQAVPDTPVVLTPNGVDVDFFNIDPAVQRDSHSAMYVGDYKYFPNTDAVEHFAKDIMPLVAAQRPDFHFTVVGKDPSPDVQALANENITVTGLVDDVRPYLQQSAVFACALRSGSGTRFKLMEALACGCPVVSTSLGCEGLGAVDGEHMLIRDDPRDFADAVLDLLNNPQKGAAMGIAGRQWVVERHAWQHSADLVREAYRKIMPTQ